MTINIDAITKETKNVATSFEFDEELTIVVRASTNINVSQSDDWIMYRNAGASAYDGSTLTQTFRYNMAPNLSQESISVTLTFSNSYGNKAILNLTVTPSDGSEICPLWKDKNVLESFGNTSERATIFLAENLGDDVFQFTVQQKPDATGLVAIMNDVIAQFYSRPIPYTVSPNTQVAANLMKKIHIWDISASFSEEILFKYDWSYDSNGVIKASDPIRREIGKRQLFVASILNAVYENPVKGVNDQGQDRYSLFLWGYDAAMGADVGIWMFDVLETQPSVTKMIAGGIEYKVIDDDCYSHALYYLNAYGGWDSLLIKGNTKKRDLYERSLISKAYSNTSSESRGISNYANKIDTEWSFVTGWLSDEEASRMHHLLGSTSVYLMDLNAGDEYGVKEIIPVVLTDAECEYKTYRGEGLKMVSYTITARLAKEKIRR